MKKIVSFLKFFNPSLILLMAYIIKMCITQPTYQDSLIVGFLSFIYISTMYFLLKKDILSENKFRVELNRDIADLKNKVSSIGIQQNQGSFLKR